MEAKASIKHLQMSAQKVRLVASLIRNKKTTDAIIILKSCTKAAATPLFKLLYSAISNATNMKNMNANNLYIKTLLVNESRTLKRIFPRAKGTANFIKKRSSKIWITLKEYDGGNK